ncbi:hypothetical protein FRB99_008739 [Tulasnella sp. 403]|nr:hypothetical protein FRB99_008739 [Tulasnella sp. 403]
MHSTRLAEKSFNSSSYKENPPKISQSHPLQSSPSKHRSNARRTTHARGNSSISSITGNTAIRAVQQAASRHSRRSSSPSPSQSGLQTLPNQSTPLNQQSPPGSVTYRLPTSLPRPKNFPQVTSQALMALDPSMEPVKLPYLKGVLQARCDAMLRGLAAVDANTAQLPPSGLPQAIRLHINQTVGAQYPSHLLCVIDDKTSRGQLYPIHAVVFVAHCARFPKLPPPAAPSPDSSTSIVFPVASIRISHPESFPLLFDYLYTKQFTRFVSSLVPLSPSAMPPQDDTLNPMQRLDKIVDALASTCTSAALLERLRFMHGLWTNVCQLGISEDGVWRVMNTAWSVLLKALVRTQQHASQSPDVAA